MLYIFFFKQKTAYEMRISDWSSDVCSSDLCAAVLPPGVVARHRRHVRAAAPCRTGARNGVGAAGREAERRAGRSMGPDLAMRSRRGVCGPARRAADAFCRRADQRAGVYETGIESTPEEYPRQARSEERRVGKGGERK